MSFGGFPPRARLVPVPSPLFGPLLEEIDDLAELKCTLRIIWLLHQKRGYPRFVTLGELLADRTLAKALSAGGPPDRQRMEGALAKGVRRGTLATGTVERPGGVEQLYVLNTEPDRRALERVTRGGLPPASLPKAEPWEGPVQRPNIFTLYEDNIGMLSPMIAEQLREAEALYPPAWIEDAFREAVSLNSRSWRYIARILDRWEREGRSNGEPGRRTKKAGYY